MLNWASPIKAPTQSVNAASPLIAAASCLPLSAILL